MINGDTSFSILRLLETPGVGVVRVNAVLEYANNLKIDIGDLLSDHQALQSVLTKSQGHDLFSNLDTVSDI